MTKVFLSGSRRLSRINDAIRERLDNMASNHLSIIVGDASGADKAMQTHLAEIGYEDVTVFCAGEHCRNNVGHWAIRTIDVSDGVKGREFYARKDREMARLADIGFVLWDGKSAGSMANIVELLKLDKKAVVYFGPDKTFYTLCDEDDVNALLDKCDPDTLETIRKKVRLGGSLGEPHEAKQEMLPL